MENKKVTSDIEALLFRPSKVSWGVQKAIIKLNPKIERLALLTIIIVVVSGIIWAHFSFQAIVVNAFGEITPVAAPIPVLSKTGFTIKRIAVKDNQELTKDDIIIETNRNLSEIEKKEINKVFEDLHRNLMKEKEGTCEEECLSVLKNISEDRLKFQDHIDQNYDFYRDLVEFNKTLKDYIVQLRSMKTLSLTLTSLNNEIKITKKRIEEIEKRNAQKVLALEYEEFQNKLISLETQVKEKELNSKAMLDNSRTNYDVSLGKIPQSFKGYLENSNVKAPTTGRIRFTGIKGVGQTVNAGEVLFVMTQASSDLWLKFQIGESDLSKVKPSQEARLDLSSYPASEYGIQKAVVTEVLDKLPVENDQQKTPNFTGYAKLNSQSVNFKNKDYPLRSGMQANVKIIIRHETVLNILIKKMFSIKDEYLGDLL